MFLKNSRKFPKKIIIYTEFYLQTSKIKPELMRKLARVVDSSVSFENAETHFSAK